MEESKTSAVSETFLEKEKNSEATMDRPLTAESADPSASGCESTTQAEGEEQLRLVVTLLTLKVLTKCDALQNRGHEEWVSHAKHLVNQTMEGLTISESFCPDAKNIKRVSKAVIKDLEKKFCGRHLLQTLISLQDPVVDTAIVRSLQVHIKECSARLAEKAASQSGWKNMLQVMGFVAIILGAFFIIVIIP